MCEHFVASLKSNLLKLKQTIKLDVKQTPCRTKNIAVSGMFWEVKKQQGNPQRDCFLFV